MKYFVRKFRNIRLNRHVYSEDDAFRLCEEYGVDVIFEDMQQDGFYMKVQGKAAIHLRRGLRGIPLLYTLLHELAHHILHAKRYKNAAFFCIDLQESKQHHEAEAFALMAILPEPFLRRLLTADLLGELEGYPKKLIMKRLRLLDVYEV